MKCVRDSYISLSKIYMLKQKEKCVLLFLLLGETVKDNSVCFPFYLEIS